jgi:hypothetical protein
VPGPARRDARVPQQGPQRPRWRRQPRRHHAHAYQGAVQRRSQRAERRRARDAHQLAPGGLRDAGRRRDAGAAVEGRRPVGEHRDPRRGRRHLPDPAPPPVRDRGQRRAAPGSSGRLRRILRVARRRATASNARVRLPRADRLGLHISPRARGHPHQSLGLAVGLPAHAWRAANARAHGQGSRPAAVRRPADPSGRRRPRRRRHPRGGSALRGRELQGAAELRHHPRRLAGARGGPPPRRSGTGAADRDRPSDDRVLELLRRRQGPRRIGRTEAHWRRPAEHVARADRGHPRRP